jgi:hypothetical protein
MDKLNILERNVLIRAMPILMVLFAVGTVSYLLTITAERGSSAQGLAAISSLISMSLLVGASTAFLFLELGLRRLRSGL